MQYQQAAREEEHDIYFVLQRLGLKEFYPEKISRTDFFEIKAKVSDTTCRQDKMRNLVDDFIYNLRFRNTTARNIQDSKPLKIKDGIYFKQNDGNKLHPLDVIIALYLCCDPIAKQDFVSLCWECKFALPLLIKLEQLEPMHLFIWPLRAIKNNKNETIIDCENPVIAFARFDEIDSKHLSKSILLNAVASQLSTGTEFPIFYHKNLTGSVRKKASFVYGLIETAFSEIPDRGECTFLNLRGDMSSTELFFQSQLLCSIASLLVITCRLNEIDKSKQFLQRDFTVPFSVLFFLTDTRGKEYYDTFHGFRNCFSHKSNLTIKCISLEENNLPDTIDIFNNLIKNQTLTRTSFKEIANIAEQQTGIHVDIKDFELAKALVKPLQDGFNYYRDEGSESTFPLQGKSFSDLTSALNEFHRLTKLDNQNPVEYKEDLMSKVANCRADQRQCLLSKHSIVKVFSNLIKSAESENISIQNCLTLIKHDVDAFNQRKNRKISGPPLQLTHFIKEIGQAYEATTGFKTLSEFNKRLPSIAVQTLLHGYPIELMDGPNAFVSIEWVNAVLRELVHTLKQQHNTKHINVKVMSILGKTGSGKSTLLNVMFGSQFDVSSGHDTHGVNLYLAKVSNGTIRELENDYLLIVDTEGLGKKYSLEKERELATFAIGLASITILNITREDTEYFKNVLSIVALAFLRMKLVGLSSSCVIVHQNYDPMHITSLLSLWRKIERHLDEATQQACELENVDKKRFTDIVSLNTLEDLHCFSPYRQGRGPLETVSKGYSESAMKLFVHLLEKDEIRDFKEIAEHFKILCYAIRKDNFVFEYKNAIEAHAHILISKTWGEYKWKLRQYAHKCMLEAEKEIVNATTVDHCKSIYQEQLQTLEQKLLDRRCVEGTLEKLDGRKYYIFRKHVSKWKTRLTDDQTHIHAAVEKATISELCQMFRVKCQILNLETTCADLEVHTFIECELENTNETYPSPSELFNLWQSKLGVITSEDSELLLENFALRAIFEEFSSYNRNEIVDRREKFKKFDIDDRRNNYFPQILEVAMSEKEVKHQQQTAHIVVENVTRDIVSYLKNRKKTNVIFHHDIHIFFDALKIMKSHKFLNHKNIMVEKVFMIDFAIHITNIVREHIMKCERSDEKSRFKEIYELQVKSKDETFQELIKTVVCEQSFTDVSETICDALESFKINGSRVLKSKRSLQLYVLWNLLDDGQIEDIKYYILYPLENILVDYIVIVYDKFTGIDSEWNDVIYKLATEESDRVLFELKQILSRIDEFNQNRNLSVDNLYDELQLKLPISKLTFQRLLKYKPLKIEVQEFLFSGIRKMKMEIFEKKYDHIREVCVEVFRNKLIGCTNRCSFCNEMCILADAEHSGPHKVLLHKQELVKLIDGTDHNLESCSQRIDRGESVNHWSSESELDASYWKIIMVKCFSARLPETFTIPESWNTLDLENEKAKLVRASISK